MVRNIFGLSCVVVYLPKPLHHGSLGGEPARILGGCLYALASVRANVQSTTNAHILEKYMSFWDSVGIDLQLTEVTKLGPSAGQHICGAVVMDIELGLSAVKRRSACLKRCKNHYAHTHIHHNSETQSIAPSSSGRHRRSARPCIMSMKPSRNGSKNFATDLSKSHCTYKRTNSKQLPLVTGTF